MAPLVAFLPLITAGIGAAAAGVSIAEMQSAPTAPTDTATKQADAASAAANAQAEALTKRRGLAATQLTSPMGVGGQANTQKATLG